MPQTNTQFCQSFDWILPFVWNGKTGFFRYADGAIAKLELAEGHISGVHVGFRITILNKREGKVDTTLFKFDDHFDPSLEARSDGRRDYPDPQNSSCFTVSGSTRFGWDWYIAKPKSTVAFRDAVESYIKMFA